MDTTLVLFIVLLLFGSFLFATTTTMRFFVRTTILVLLIPVATTYAMLSPLVLPALGMDASDVNPHLAYSYKHLVSWFLPIRVEVEGHFDERRPCVFICNHQSELDFTAMANAFPSKAVILAKESIKYIPFMGWYMVIARNVFINRFVFIVNLISNRGSALETMAKVATTLNEKKVGVFMFPEGTRSRQTTNELLPFKKGAFVLAVQGQIPIFPIVVSSYHSVFNIKNMLFEGGVIRIKILPAIETAGLTMEEVDKLTLSTHKLMSDTLVEISDPAPLYAEPLKIKEVGKKKKE
ncbi:1-acylglycerol-3-phosphate O-acyltransferase [Podochytrium sp. JEL0797]|nr:1-acylglycerol-3-phosphate O-acyltransferase [Podochytrium sp. JEL0797]